MTSETATAMTAEQIEKRLSEIAPYPEWGRKVTAEGLARYLAVCAQLGWARNLTPFVPDDMLHPAPLVVSQFAATHALAALLEVDPGRASQAAKEIAEAWNDGGGVGEWLWEHLTKFGVNPAEVSALDETRLALEKAQRASRDVDAFEPDGDLRCDAPAEGFNCTRRRHTAGDHVAHGGHPLRVLHSWAATGDAA